MRAKRSAKFLLILALLGLARQGFGQQNNKLNYVNPFIGTSKSNVPTKWGNNGGTYPGAVAPSGAVQLTPETSLTGNRGYDYADSSIYYFSCFNHLSGFPFGASGRFFIMPVGKQDNFEDGAYSRPFLHRNERAHPGFYSVVFDDDGTLAEATATLRTGLFRFTFKAKQAPRIFIGDTGELLQQSKRSLHFSNGHTVVNLGADVEGIKPVKGGWLLSFPADPNHQQIIGIQLSASSVSFAGAQNNLDKEIGGANFDEVCLQTSREWAKKLAVIEVRDNSEQNKTVFYTALYHSLLIPWVIEDADGQYAGADGKIQQKSGRHQYGGFSPWDTFRSLNPLLTLLYPEKENDVILSMLDVYKQTGHLPTETMTGNHAIAIIVDTYLKGVAGFDKEFAYKAMKSNIMEAPFVQNDMQLYNENGYIPYTRSESVTRTLEYAYDDWALSQYAKQVMAKQSDYKLLLDRGFNYRNLLNTDKLFMLPRNQNNFKLQPGMGGYKEGDQWVYTYFVPQNARDLINLLGGNAEFASRLDSALSHKVILFDNEPVFHLPYLFNQASNPALTQKWCRYIMQELYSATPGGLPGNDDLGSTSSWFVFSAIGIYPVCPGRPTYAIGSPLFQSVTLHLPNGKEFSINSVHSSLKNYYVQAVAVNGKPWEQLTLPHVEITSGGRIAFRMIGRPGLWPKHKNPVNLSETKTNAEFKVSDFYVTHKTAGPDELFFAKFSLTNRGSAGTKTVHLIVNGKPYGQKNCYVPAGHTIHDSIACRLYPLGISWLTIEGTGMQKVIVKALPFSASNSYRISALSAKPMVRLHDVQYMAYQVQNIRGLKQMVTLKVNVNDSLVFTDTITLRPGEKKVMKHEFRALERGFQTIRIDSNQVRYKVYSNASESLILDLSSIKFASDYTIIDKSGFSNNGHVISIADNTRTADAALLFGKNCFVEMPRSASLDILDEQITMMAWVYPIGLNGGLTDIFTKGDTNVLQLSGGKSLTFFAGGWGRGDCTVDLPSDWLNHWHHIAGVCRGKSLFLYIDGILKGTTVTDKVANLSVNNKWVLGRNDEFPSEREFQGYIHCAKVFQEALSGQEIGTIFTLDKP